MVNLISLIYIYFFVLFSKNVYSKTAEEPAIPRWLPKCCPLEKQFSYDGKSCVTDDRVILDHLEIGTLNITVDGLTDTYKLKHTSKFNCLRQEVHVIKNNLLVMSDNDIIIWDDLGENWTLSRSEICVDSITISETDNSQLVFVALLCPVCEDIVCLHKCCSEGDQLQISKDGAQVNCVPSNETFSSQQFLRNSSKSAFVFHGFPECRHSMYVENIEEPIEIVARGDLRLSGMTVLRTEYCVDSSDRHSLLMACRQLPASAAFRPILYGSFFCVGAVFLGLTLVLHLWLPELRKSLHSCVLVCHVACLLVGYLGLAAVNLVHFSAPSTICSAAAFTIQFSMLAAIFWLNVMCVDIAWTFSGLRAPKASLTLDSDGHKFLYYSLYAWGSTAAISAVTAFLEYSPAIPSSSRFKPSFGATTCWFQYPESILLLMYGPMAVLLLTNVVLFAYTACKIKRTHRDTANLVQHAGSKLRENKDRFTLYLKLFGLMGVTWVLEVMSWLLGGPESYWYATDAINGLRSVFIFIMFCFKKKVLVLIKAKFTTKKKPKFPMNSRRFTTSSSKTTSSMSSQRTNSIQLSQIS